MITPDATSPTVATGSAEDVDGLLDALRSGQAPEGADALPAEFLSTVADVVTTPAGSMDVVLSSPQGYSTHEFTLSRAGALRRSRGTTSQEEIALHPMTVLPGALLRLVGISPVEASDPSVLVEAEGSVVDALFAEDADARSEAWRSVTTAMATLPSASRQDLEDAAPRAARVVRHRPEGSRSATTLMLRGRYLLPAEDPTGGLHGTTATGAARAVMTALLR